MTFENKYAGGVYYSRIIASWVNAGGDFKINLKERGVMNTKFAKWLKSLGISDHEIWEIWNLATCGKLELETNAKRFLKESES